MMWLLLFGLTALVVLLPMLPAISEWRWPTDVEPLYIDNQDALDPPYLAHSFVARLATALALGQTKLGRSSIAAITAQTDWPLDEAERRAATSWRVWHVAGDARLPAGVSFLAEVAARGTLHAATGGVYRALWAEDHLQLAPQCYVQRWAHGSLVTVGTGCRLAGRVSADESIVIMGQTSFMLLHAPTVRFAPAAAAAVPATSALAQTVFKLGVPQEVSWDSAAARGICHEPLDVGDYSAWRGDLVCRADLWLGTGCNVMGSLKCHGDIVVDAFSIISGSIVAEGSIELGQGCQVRGLVISETAVRLGADCVIGAPGHPSTVAAPRIEVAAGVVVHGTVWAGEQGHSQANTLANLPTAQTGSPGASGREGATAKAAAA